MPNEQNLKPISSTSEAREKGAKGGKKRAENAAKRKTLREELLLLLSAGNTQEKMSLALLQKALNGDTKAFEIIRDTVGEKPTDKQIIEGNSGVNVIINRESVAVESNN